MPDVKEKVLCLLQFIEGSLHEAVKHPHTLEDCLTEADCTLRILDRDIKNDDKLNALFALSPLNHYTFMNIAEYKARKERIEAINRGLAFVAETRTLLRRP
jgi:hypothetical protein